MNDNPYESPQEKSGKTTGRWRWMTLGVLLMLCVLIGIAMACIILLIWVTPAQIQPS